MNMTIIDKKEEMVDILLYMILRDLQKLREKLILYKNLPEGSIRKKTTKEYISREIKKYIAYSDSSVSLFMGYRDFIDFEFLIEMSIETVDLLILNEDKEKYVDSFEDYLEYKKNMERVKRSIECRITEKEAELCFLILICFFKQHLIHRDKNIKNKILKFFNSSI